MPVCLKSTSRSIGIMEANAHRGGLLVRDGPGAREMRWRIGRPRWLEGLRREFGFFDPLYLERAPRVRQLVVSDQIRAAPPGVRFEVRGRDEPPGQHGAAIVLA